MEGLQGWDTINIEFHGPLSRSGFFPLGGLGLQKGDDCPASIGKSSMKFCQGLVLGS